MHGVHKQGLPENRLRELRIARGLTYMDVANAVEKWPTTIVRWEKGTIPQEHWATLAELLGVDAPYLTGWSDEVAA